MGAFVGLKPEKETRNEPVTEPAPTVVSEVPEPAEKPAKVTKRSRKTK